MKKETVIFGFIAIAAAAFLIGRASHNGGDAKSGTEGGDKAAVKAVAKGDSDILPVGTSYVRGPATAPVTIVEFSDFQCPFCGRVTGTLKQIEDTYKDKVRITFKHTPLPFHKNAPLAAEAALAAGDQGKFWEMHDKLFANQQKLERADLESYAQELGLDMNKFKADLDTGKWKKVVAEDQALGEKVGARGTPNFFINGVQVVGAQPFDSFKKVIDDQLAAAEQAQKDGTKPDEIYAALVKKNFKEPPKAQANAQPRDDSKDVYKVPVGSSPVRGPADAPITIVLFSDFQCPFCGRVEPTLKQVMDTYPGKVRVVWKNNPLPFHPNAMPSAKAAMAANAQGKFWEFHDKLFSNQQAETPADFEKDATELGLNMDKFKADQADPKIEQAIKDDMALADQIGAQGTPNMFINGRKIVGAQPIDNFKKIIDEELPKADKLVQAGTPAAQVYDKLTENGLTKAPAAAPSPKPQMADDTSVYKVPVNKEDPIRGASDALVTIVEFSDYQCPFCKRVEPTLKQLLDKYPKDVRIVFKESPLPFHPNAMPAALAAMAAHAQGKFWEMHDKMYDNQQALSPADFEKYAQEIGLNMTKFKADLAANKGKEQIAADQALAQQVGAGGTPNFYINGRHLVGAQPFESFDKLVSDELKKAQALTAKGVARTAVYDEIMKTAQTKPAAQPAAQDQDDDKVYDVKVNPNDFIKGSPKAKVTIVEFSDFQCPFCGRASNTVKQVEDKYGKDVRVVFKHNPLSFHENAPLAAEAALAAGEQGKFWEMHDQLFSHQQALTRPDLEKYAQELGLNMTKFKSALDSHKFKAQIDGNIAEARAVGATGTPTFFINGKKVRGAQPIEAFQKVIDEALKKK
jgi:protein-disulfide isomerase